MSRIVQFFSRISKRLRRKDCMTLPACALEKHIEKAHTPIAETFLMAFVYDIKNLLEPYLNGIKNHVYPHSYTFFKKKMEKYKWNIKLGPTTKWLAEGCGLQMLNGIPEGTPSLVRPEFRKQLETVKQLEESVNKCKRLSKEDRQWWKSFIDNEKRYRQKWEAASEELLNNHKKQQWLLLKLKKHLSAKVEKRKDPDQEALEQNLEDLLRKADHCPNVSFLVVIFPIFRLKLQHFSFTSVLWTGCSTRKTQKPKWSSTE